MTEQKENVQVSKQELEVYDRQVRLWGIEAQTKLRNAKVLIIGGTQLGAEVAKTMSLAGVDEMHLVDHRLVNQSEIGSNFLYDASVDNTTKTKWAAAHGFLSNLNRNVKLFIVEEDLLSKPDAEIESFVRGFTIVIVLDESYERKIKLNEICHKNQIRFISGAVYGWIGYAFFDFDGHNILTKIDPIELVVLEGQAAGGNAVLTVEDETYEPKKTSYPTFTEALSSNFSNKKVLRKCKRIVPPSYFLVKTMLRASLEGKLTGDPDKDISELVPIWKEEVIKGNHTLEMQPVQPEKFNHLFSPEFGPTTACVGGMIGQEAIRTITEGKHAIRNLFIYSALDSSGTVCNFPLA